MESTTSQISAADDPASAFAELRGEVSLLRRAVEGLTAERQNAPDYTATLAATASQLGEVRKMMTAVAQSPAMRLTPENLSHEIAKAGATARAGDRDNLDRASASLQTSIASIDGVVGRAWAAERQDRWLIGAALIGALAGMLLCSILPGEFARALPESWNVPERMAARVLRLDIGQAGARMIAVSNARRVRNDQEKRSAPSTVVDGAATSPRQSAK